MTIESNNKQTGLESFFPSLIDIDKDLPKPKKENIITTTTTTTTILIQRRSPTSDIWICNSCTFTGDKWFMEKHLCKQNITNNFAKAAQQFQE
jgi:frataxin-like iron-binding protein CyaY